MPLYMVKKQCVMFCEQILNFFQDIGQDDPPQAHLVRANFFGGGYVYRIIYDVRNGTKNI